jgi:hypothetical protein
MITSHLSVSRPVLVPAGPDRAPILLLDGRFRRLVLLLDGRFRRGAS